MLNKYLIIVNNSANGTKKNWPLIKRDLDQKQINYSATISKYHRNAILITEEYIKAANQNDILLVIGNSELLNEVVNASEEITHEDPDLPKLPIGYIPMGKQNDFTQQENISLDWHKSLNHILSNGNHFHYAKLGYFDEIIKHQRVYFLNNVGIGLNANLINIIHHSKISWRIFRYFINIFKLLYNLQSFTMEIYHTHKTTTYHNVFLADISLLPNSKRYNFELTIIKRCNLLIMFYIFFKLLFKHKINLKNVYSNKIKKLHLSVPTLEFSHADGEDLGDRFYDAHYHVTKYPFI